MGSERKPQVGDRVRIDPALGYDVAPVRIAGIEHGAARLPGYGWFDLDDLIIEDREADRG